MFFGQVITNEVDQIHLSVRVKWNDLLSSELAFNMEGLYFLLKLFRDAIPLQCKFCILNFLFLIQVPTQYNLQIKIAVQTCGVFYMYFQTGKHNARWVSAAVCVSNI